MSAVLMDGKSLAEQVKGSLNGRVSSLTQLGIQPGLAVVLVGNDPASQIYVTRKIKQCESVGIMSFQHFLPKETPQAALEGLIKVLNDDPAVHGILLQLPLPLHLNSDSLINCIHPRKDVDGLTQTNIGALVKEDPAAFIPCTPKGCLKLLKSYVGDLSGKQVAVVGRSHLVGRPLIQLFLQDDSTVSIVHSRTVFPEKITQKADILVAAAGRPGLVKASWVKPGAAVIDVGINRLDTPELKKLVGDVDFDSVREIAGFITPVPGGVGPMTVACLLENTIEAAERSVSWI